MRARLNRAWRVFATGAGFLLFGIGGLLLTLFALPALRLLVRAPDARKHRTQQLISAAFSAFIGFLRNAGVLNYRTTGLKYLNTPGCLVIANHPSLIDVVFLIAFMPEVDCVVKQRIWHNPITGAAARQAGYISNADTLEMIERCQNTLKAGNRLIIFPEGTRTRPGQPLRFQRGAANIALHAGAEIVPVVITLRESTLTKADRWYHVPVKKLYLSISADRPFAARAYMDRYGNVPKAARRLTADLCTYYTDRLAAADRLPENDGRGERLGSGRTNRNHEDS